MCEINIDYSEYNDIETIENDKLLDSVNLFIGKLTTLIENSERTINVYKGIDVAIIGKPNSGKSSLFNSLLEEEKAIVTNIEGTTRDVLDGEFQIGGILFKILDTRTILKILYDIKAIDRKIQIEYPKLKEEFKKAIEKFDREIETEIIVQEKQKKEVGLELMSDLAYTVYCYLTGNDGSEAIKIQKMSKN